MQSRHFFRFALAFSILFAVGIITLFAIHYFDGGGSEKPATLIERIQEINGGK